MTTTNWQAYSGESALGYLAQMLLGWQNFVAAAVGVAVLIASIRGFTRSNGSTLGKFWVDLTRSLLYVFLPICVLGAVLFIWQGTPQNFQASVAAHSLEGSDQTLTGGPIASQEIIKQLGVNGGGFVAVNSTAPRSPDGILGTWSRETLSPSRSDFDPVCFGGAIACRACRGRIRTRRASPHHRFARACVGVPLRCARVALSQREDLVLLPSACAVETALDAAGIHVFDCIVTPTDIAILVDDCEVVRSQAVLIGGAAPLQRSA